MKTKQIIYTALILIFSINLLSAQELDNNVLAKKILTNTFDVQPGNVIIINGGQHTLGLMEALVIEAEKMGAIVITRINTDKMSKSYYNDVPEKYYNIGYEYWLNWLDLLDVWINLPWTENPKDIYENISREKLAKINKASKSFTEALDKSKLIGDTINYPTKALADYSLMDFDKFKEVQWKAINADYQKIAKDGAKLKDLITNSDKIEISTKQGTKLSFSVKGRKCIVRDGTVDKTEKKSGTFENRWQSLPGGTVRVSIIENSGKGKVLIPKSMCSYKTQRNISFNVKKGKLTDYKAEKNEKCFIDDWNLYESPKDMIGGLVIGLNREIVIDEKNAEYRPGFAGGMVYIWFGSNTSLGGKNVIKGEPAFWFPITNATVKIDGKVVIKNGKLTL